MAGIPIPTWHAVFVVVRRGDRYLVVREGKGRRCWFLPAGQVERGESLVDAAVRETAEESGVRVRLTGVIRVEHAQTADGARLRVFFLAEPIGDDDPKSSPDEHSLGASWVTSDGLRNLPFRVPAIRDAIHAVDAGCPIAPLSILAAVGAPWPTIPSMPSRSSRTLETA